MPTPAGLDRARCPQCGQPNACGLAAGQPDCWCAHTAIDRAAIDRLPEDVQRKVCLCRTCGAAAPSEPDPVDV